MVGDNGSPTQIRVVHYSCTRPWHGYLVSGVNESFRGGARCDHRRCPAVRHPSCANPSVTIGIQGSDRAVPQVRDGLSGPDFAARAPMQNGRGNASASLPNRVPQFASRESRLRLHIDHDGAVVGRPRHRQARDLAGTNATQIPDQQHDGDAGSRSSSTAAASRSRSTRR